jgi:hypothetical protein
MSDRFTVFNCCVPRLCLELLEVFSRPEQDVEEALTCLARHPDILARTDQETLRDSERIVLPMLSYLFCLDGHRKGLEETSASLEQLDLRYDERGQVYTEEQQVLLRQGLPLMASVAEARREDFFCALIEREMFASPGALMNALFRFGDARLADRLWKLMPASYADLFTADSKIMPYWRSAITTLVLSENADLLHWWLGLWPRGNFPKELATSLYEEVMRLVKHAKVVKESLSALSLAQLKPTHLRMLVPDNDEKNRFVARLILGWAGESDGWRPDRQSAFDLFAESNKLAARRTMKAVLVLLKKKGMTATVAEYERLLVLAAMEVDEGPLARLLALGIGGGGNLDGQGSALHAAVQFRRITNISLLLVAGANPTCRDERGRTPLALAELLQAEDIVRLLKEKSVS